MPYIVVTTLFPYEKAPQCGEKYVEALKKYPLDESLAVYPIYAEPNFRIIIAQFQSLKLETSNLPRLPTKYLEIKSALCML